MRHIASVHISENFECILSKTSFKRKDYLQRHQSSIHHRKTEATCLKCQRIFTRASNTRKHQKMCCMCIECSKYFETVNDSKDPNCTNLSDREATSEEKLSRSEDNKNKATCSNTEALSSEKKTFKIKCPGHNEAATYPATKNSEHEILYDESMDKIDLDVKEFIEKYWSSIRSFTKKNKVQNI